MAELLAGFRNLRDVANERVVDRLVPVVTTAITATLAEHTRTYNDAVALLVQRTTEYKVSYRTPVANRLQPLTQDGRALPVKGGAKYDVAFPIQSAGSAWGDNHLTRVKQTVQAVNDQLDLMIDGDLTWNLDHIIGALLYPLAWAYEDEEHGELTIQPFANADTTVYQIRQGAAAGESGVQHYVAQAAAIADGTNPFPAMYTALTRRPENGGRVVALIPENLRASVEALATFIEEADPDAQGPDTETVLVARFNNPVPGEIIGKVGRVWISVWARMPDDYIAGVVTEGPRPLAMREHPEPELQGFTGVATREDHPFFERQYVRHAGYGAFNRVGAYLVRIGNAAYGNGPTGYGLPMR